MSCEGGTLAQGCVPGTGRLSSNRLLGPKCGHRAARNKTRKSSIGSQFLFMCKETGQRAHGLSLCPLSLWLSWSSGCGPHPSTGQPRLQDLSGFGKHRGWQVKARGEESGLVERPAHHWKRPQQGPDCHGAHFPGIPVPSSPVRGLQSLGSPLPLLPLADIVQAQVRVCGYLPWVRSQKIAKLGPSCARAVWQWLCLCDFVQS